MAAYFMAALNEKIYVGAAAQRMRSIVGSVQDRLKVLDLARKAQARRVSTWQPTMPGPAQEEQTAGR